MELQRAIPGGGTEPLTVLIIDDDADIRHLLGRVVRRLGLEAVEAGDGQSGLELLQRHGAIACVILDLYMPIFAGPTTLRALRASWPGLPVVLISGDPDDLSAAGGGDALTAQVRKPFTVGELREALRQLLGADALPPAR